MTKPNKINAKRLLKLAEFLDKLPRSHFDFGIVRSDVEPTKANECGTVGCAIGWCPAVFPRLCRATIAGVRPVGDRLERWETGFSRTAVSLFGLAEADAISVFTPHRESPADGESLPYAATPEQVARRIRTYVKWKQKQEAAGK